MPEKGPNFFSSACFELLDIQCILLFSSLLLFLFLCLVCRNYGVNKKIRSGKRTQKGNLVNLKGSYASE